MTKLVSYCPVDAACDQMAVRFQQDSLPPVLSEGKKEGGKKPPKTKQKTIKKVFAHINYV